MTKTQREARRAVGAVFGAAAHVNGQTMRIANEAYAQASGVTNHAESVMTPNEQEAYKLGLRYMMRAAKVLTTLERRMSR